MITHDTDINTAGGMMNTFIVHPDEGGPFPVVVLLMDAPGIRPELHQMATRLATSGFLVVLPNLYYRREREFSAARADRSEMVAHMNSLSNAMVCEDVLDILQFLASEGAAKSGPIGVVGYCMSGPFAFAAAAAFPEKIAAAASIHGVRLYTEAEDSPHRNADRITAELYFGCAERDEWAPAQMMADLDAHLATLDLNYRVETYPDTQHGFVFPERGDIYAARAAETHWSRLLALFSRTLL